MRLRIMLLDNDRHPEVIKLADTASEILEIKHAYQQDIEPQPGIDY